MTNNISCQVSVLSAGQKPPRRSPRHILLSRARTRRPPPRQTATATVQGISRCTVSFGTRPNPAAPEALQMRRTGALQSCPREQLRLCQGEPKELLLPRGPSPWPSPSVLDKPRQCRRLQARPLPVCQEPSQNQPRRREPMLQTPKARPSRGLDPPGLLKASFLSLA